MPELQLRPQFQTQHMRATAIELSNRQNTGWTQRKDATELLDITYPIGDVRRALDAVSTSAGKPVVMMGQLGSGKSQIHKVVFVGIDADGNRCKPLERMLDSLAALAPSSASLLTPEKRAEYATALLPEMLHRDLAHKGLLTDSATLAWRLLAWVEVV